MKQVGTGFEALRTSCERLSISATLGTPLTDVPSTVLGQPLEPTLRALYHEHDGVWWSSPEFSLRVYPLEGPDSLEWRNVSLRRSAEDYVPPYPFDGLLALAQYGRQASYLAAVPALRDKAGRQPVLFLDTHEDPWAVPVASSLDGAFAVIAQYLDRATAQRGRAGLGEVSFPLEVPDLIAADAWLSSRVAAGGFRAWTRGDASIHDWIRDTFGMS